jgi:tetratricopeptide (TPR) repeat protein
VRSALMLTLLLASRTALAGPSDELDKARIAFRQQDCSSAIPRLKDVLYPNPKLADPSDTFDARAMLGACFVEAGEREEAKAEFERAIQIKPKEPLDPMFFSEPARRLFDDTKADIENRAKKDEELRKLQQQREALEAYRKSLRVYKTTPFSANFLPFGLNQRETTGDTLKWTLVGAGQAVTLGTSVGIWYYLVNKYGLRSDKVPPDEAQGVLYLQGIEIATGSAFILLYAYSVWDSWRHWEPQKLVEGDDELLKKALDDPNAPKPAPKPAAKTSLRDVKVLPMLSPDTVGIGLGWEIK